MINCVGRIRRGRWSAQPLPTQPALRKTVSAFYTRFAGDVLMAYSCFRLHGSDWRTQDSVSKFPPEGGSIFFFEGDKKSVLFSAEVLSIDIDAPTEQKLRLTCEHNRLKR